MSDDFGSNSFVNNEFVKKKFFKLLIIINTPHTKKDLFQLSLKYFFLFMYAPIVADINKNIPPTNNVLGKKKTPVKKMTNSKHEELMKCLDEKTSEEDDVSNESLTVKTKEAS